MTILQRALEFLKLGISVIPLWHRSKGPMMPWERYNTILSTERQVFNWLASGWNNYGVVTGWRGLTVIDFDDFYTFGLWKSYMELMKLPMPYTVLSSRGAHVYISAPSGSNQKRRGVDVKYHGYVVGPGSTHPSGTMYTPINELRLMPVESLEVILPEELFPMVVPVVSPTFWRQMPKGALETTNTEYDAFQSATVIGGMDLITKVKRAVRIESFFADMHKTSIDGRWYAALCPFHDDHNPSMWIDVRRQLCGCQVCGMKPMDAINLYSRMKNIPESAAVTMMAREVGVWA